MTGKCKHQSMEEHVYCSIEQYPSGICECYENDEVEFCEGFKKVISDE